MGDFFTGDLSKAQTIEDLRRMAQRQVPRMFYDYADSGSYSESTYRGNETGFQAYKLRQRVARNIDNRSVRTTFLSKPVPVPLALAPVGLTGMQWPDGEIRAAQAAEAYGVPFCLSTMSICSIEDVAAHTTAPFWFQLYVMRDREFAQGLIDRAKRAGCSALVLTLDLQVLGQRHKDMRNGLTAPPRPTPRTILDLARHPAWCLRMLDTKRRNFGNIVGHAKGVDDLKTLSSWTHEQFDPTLDWSAVEWIKERWGGPLILKGIADVEDARIAAGTGADAIVVSNHGGRQLDSAPAAIHTLKPIVDAVGDRMEVYLDSGVRTGGDVLKALALGARGCWIGRPFVYGLGAGGADGVTRALQIIEKELDITMALCGERDVHDLGVHNFWQNEESLRAVGLTLSPQETQPIEIAAE